MRTHRIVAALLLAGTSLDAASAQVVMRRPIPSLDGRSDIPSENPTPTPTPTPGATPTPTTGTPSPTPTPTPTGTPTPVGTPTPTPTGTPTPTPTDTPSDCSTTMSCPNPEADVYAWNVDCRLPAPSIQCMSYSMRQGMYGYMYRQWGVASDPTGCTSTQTADQNGFARMRGYYGLDSGFSATNDKGLCKGVQYDTDLPTGDPDPTFPPGSYIYANWDTGAWRTISGGTCGSTTIMEREVHCVASVYDSSYRLLHGGPIDAKYCADKGTQPTTRYQSESAGCYSWQLGQFSDWSSTCGFAQRQASYFCADAQGNKVDDARCTLIPREGDQYGGMSGSSKPSDERDYSTQTSGCTKKLDLGSPEVGYCENNVQDVTYPRAYCGLYDKNGSYAGSADIAECGGYPEPKQQPCGDALIRVPEPTDKSCLYNPYVEYYYGNNGGIDYGASREFIYANGNDACEQGLAKGYTCCFVGTIYDEGKYVSGPLKGPSTYSGMVTVSVSYKPRAQVYGACQVMLNDWVAKAKAKREKEGYVGEWRGEDCGFIEPGPGNPNDPPGDFPTELEPLG